MATSLAPDTAPDAALRQIVKECRTDLLKYRAIALQSRADRPEITAILQQIDHLETHLAIRAERELQRLLSGDCAMPVGVRTRIIDSRIAMEAVLFGAETDPPRRSKAEGETANPEAVAQEVFAGLE